MSDNITPMSLERFETLIAAYGADPGRWPLADLAGAQALLAASSEAQAMQARERGLDAALDRLGAPRASAALEAAILAARPRPQAARKRRGLGLRIGGGENAWRPAGVFAAAAVLGVVLGLNVVGPLGTAISGTPSDEVLAYAFSSYDENGGWQ